MLKAVADQDRGLRVQERVPSLEESEGPEHRPVERAKKRDVGFEIRQTQVIY